MKSDRFADAQIMGVIRQAEGGVSVPDLRREHGISNATFYRWRAKYGRMDASMISQMKVLEPAFAIVRDWQRRTTGLPIFWWD